MAAKTSLNEWIYIFVFIVIIPTHLLYRKKANPPEVLFLGSLSSSEKATENIPCGTKFSLVLIFAIFPAIRKHFSQKNLLLSKINIL